METVVVDQSDRPLYRCGFCGESCQDYFSLLGHYDTMHGGMRPPAET